jgi:hypothetical protein
MTGCNGAYCVEERGVREILVRRWESDTVTEASSVNHSRDLGYAVEERFDTGGQQQSSDSNPVKSYRCSRRTEDQHVF